MSIELITGRSGTAHISANDYRAINRANYGPGRYVLKDDENMEVSISTSLGTVRVAAGSCLWSGMHIRCAEASTLSYIVPASAETVYVYLHYVKNADTLIETVEWTVSVGEELSPIVDNLSDSTMEAYTEFCSFLSTATTANVRFQLVDAHTDFDLETINSNIAAAQTAAKEYTDAKSAELNAEIATVNSKVSDLGVPVTLSTQVVDFSEGDAEIEFIGNNATKDFKWIGLVFGGAWTKRACVFLSTNELVMRSEDTSGYNNKILTTNGTDVVILSVQPDTYIWRFKKTTSELRLREIIGYK